MNNKNIVSEEPAVPYCEIAISAKCSCLFYNLRNLIQLLRKCHIQLIRMYINYMYYYYYCQYNIPANYMYTILSFLQ